MRRDEVFKGAHVLGTEETVVFLYRAMLLAVGFPVERGTHHADPIHCAAQAIVHGQVEAEVVMLITQEVVVAVMAVEADVEETSFGAVHLRECGACPVRQ